MSADRPIRVLIVDDHAVVRRGIRSYLELLEDIEVFGEAENGEAALATLADAVARGEGPDVVLLDLIMPGMDGVETTERIRTRHPGVRVVVLTSFGELERVRAVLDLGAAGYLLKNADPDEVSTAIRAAMRDEVFLDPAITRRLTRGSAGGDTGIRSLTARERTVLTLVANGRSNKEIAKELVISERTARTHVSNVLQKLRLHSRTQAALAAVREGLVPPP
ncbi:DNA-binding response regulator [Enemella evansiae]|uniref:DNA-binding response regulator n=1 Tax=Enemella evansiae TaxID=2016499 RepID=A0A255GFD8_9ACTN|nr:response regulator transcription factor [Enemella evansiae]OYO09284.1 DNA-binding response regulator [Enemella evansiae]OYO13246.1 DNA-binding response regulator [Enemella evansiae]